MSAETPPPSRTASTIKAFGRCRRRGCGCAASASTRPCRPPWSHCGSGRGAPRRSCARRAATHSRAARAARRAGGPPPRRAWPRDAAPFRAAARRAWRGQRR
eukprot:scaffold7177_cov75-Phaeocystis_antarctica.AAC.6